jgi:hypothetical protein
MYDTLDLRKYEALARRRSGAAFFRQLLPECAECAICAEYAVDLDFSTKALDATIQGFVDEGFELECRFNRRGASPCLRGR